MNACNPICQAITRRKTIDERTLLQTKLKRSLNLVDLIGIGKYISIKLHYIDTINENRHGTKMSRMIKDPALLPW